MDFKYSRGSIKWSGSIQTNDLRAILIFLLIIRSGLQPANHQPVNHVEDRLRLSIPMMLRGMTNIKVVSAFWRKESRSSTAQN